MNKLKFLTLGADPELAIYDYNQKKYVYAGRYFKGKKGEPVNIDDNGHSIEVDGVNVEFCMPPATNSRQMWDSICKCIDHIDSKLPKGVESRIIASADYNEEELSTPDTRVLGCSPDWNAWLCEINSPPNAKVNFRSCGGHIHFGFEREDETPISMMDQLQVIRACDLFLGLPSLILDDSEESKRRRELYGKAGAFRMCSYGVEYRTLSNFWVENRQYIDWIFETAKQIFKFINDGNVLEDEKHNNIAEAIDNCDLALAKKIMEQYKIKVPEIWNEVKPVYVEAV